jgi:uncharacterized protein YbjQ (UPF0145 family)
VAENTLVDRDIGSGEAIVRALDSASDPSMRPTAALWFLFQEEETWRLLLALPAMASDPAQSVYARLLEIVSHAAGVEHFSFESVALMPPESSLIDLLATAIQTSADAVAGIRFSNNTINGQLIPDAYIYRLTRALPDRIAAG